MKHNLQLVWRGYLRERTFTGLNLVSLTVGLFVAYVAIHYIRFELSYDTFHQNAESVYRLTRNYRSQAYSVVGFSNWDATTNNEQSRQLDALKQATGVADAAQFITSDAATFVEGNGRRVQASNLLTTNTPRSFCSVFSWSLRAGSFGDFANGTNKVMLTEHMARLLFGEAIAEAVGQRIRVGTDSYTVAAVIADVPLNSHVDFSMAFSTPRLPYWGSRVYVQTANKANPEVVTANINAALAAFNPRLARDPLYKGHRLQPLTSLHLQSDVLYELKPPGNRLYLLLIGCFAVCIALITLFNYANLSLAIKLKQHKSIGVRKAMGASNVAIAGQFWVEGVLLSLLALPLVALLIVGCVPAFNQLMNVAIPASVFADPLTLLSLVLLAVLFGTLSSSITVLKLAPKRALSLFTKPAHTPRRFTIPVRNYLVVSQFSLLIGLMTIGYFITRQIQFIEDKDLGFRQKGVLYAYTSPEVQNVFQEKLRQLPGVGAVGNGSSFGIGTFNQTTYKLPESDVIFDDASQLYLDPAAVWAYDLRLTMGQPTGAPLPETYTLINQTAAQKLAAQLRVPVQSVIGKTIITEPEYVAENGRMGVPFTVAGIFEDINVFSLRQQVEPCFITVSSRLRMDGRTIVQFDPATTAQTLTGIRAAYNQLKAQDPLELQFLEQQVAALYEQDRRTANLLTAFNIIALLLAGIGTVGITLFLTVARTKEIGIRKVLGASIVSIIQSTTKEYVYLIGAALLISIPMAVYVVNQWLSNFAYRIDIQPLAFVVIGFLTLLFAMFLAGLIAYRAALVNPVKSLRTE